MNRIIQRMSCFAMIGFWLFGSPEMAYAQNGACCSEELGCFDDTELNCNSFGGTWVGPNTSCAADDCAFGACCLEEGCENMLQGFCSNSGGTFVAFTFCGQDPCGGDPVGACCSSLNPGAGCNDQGTQSACEAMGRIFIGAGISCTPDPCGGTDPLRACCHGEGCSEITEEFCDSIAGIWFPNVATCSTFTCAQGACCTESGCEEMLETQCNAADGEWLIFESCFDDPCGTGTGACCENQSPTSGCGQDSQANCEANGRIFIGIGIPCEPLPCSPCATCDGDSNGDAVLNGQDVQAFVGCLIEAAGGPVPEGCECS
ncbi:MAG TPA: hypothetical protein VNT79_00310, partial [Phycisphaerae bacterium]|nr:hypothetical protein [Phycisphaerae bacterium]